MMQSGGKVCDDGDAAACLAQGHPKAGNVGQSWGMRDRSSEGKVKIDAVKKDADGDYDGD